MTEVRIVEGLTWKKATERSTDGQGYLIERQESPNSRRIDVLLNYEPGDLYIPMKALRTLPGYSDCFQK